MKKKIGISLSILFVFILVLVRFLGIYNISFDGIVILSTVFCFLCCHLIFDINKMYNFIYKYRYLIGGILLLFIVLMKYNGLSISYWNRILQPSNIPKYSNPILGFPRGIRSDEWMTGTPYLLSQVFTNFSSTNNLFMAKNSIVTLYPSLPCFDISVIGKLMNIPYLILPIEYAISLNWYGRLFILFFSSFELMMIITKKNKLYSLLGAVLIAFSPANMWWYSIDMMMWGNLACIILYYFLRSNKVWKKILLSIAMGVVGLNYIFLVYPAWQIPFGYFYLAMFIWIIIKNKKYLKWKMLLYIPIVLLVIAAIFVPTYFNSKEIYDLINNTVYPGARTVLGGFAYEYLFIYIVTPLYAYHTILNPSEGSSFISLFPLPFFVGIVYLIKEKIKKHKMDLFIFLMVLFILFLSIWNFIALPNWFVKISLLSMSIPSRSYLIVCFACVFLMIYIMSHLEKNEKINIKKVILYLLLSGISYVIMALIVKTIIPEYLTKIVAIVCGIIFVPLFTCFLLNNKKINKYFAIYFIILGVLSGICANPVNKGISVMTEKPFAKEVRKITTNDPDAIWANTNASFVYANYVLANGAKIINSTNFYPNFDLWDKLDSERKYEGIYNRYAHVSMVIVNDQTSVELVGPDHILLEINVQDMCKINIKYLSSTENIEKNSNKFGKINTIYNEDGMFISELSCN